MTTLLYGEQPGADVAPGNRADAENDPAASRSHAPVPSTVPGVEDAVVAVQTALGSATSMEPAVPPVSTPTYAEPSPWSAPLVALPALLLGLLAVSAIFAGLAVWAFASAWAYTMTPLGYLVLSAIGVYFICIGVALVTSAEPQRRPATYAA
jgi:hypothetical protein